MEIVNTIFTFERIFQVGALVFSFLFIIFSIQIYANIKQIAKTVVTKRNGAILLITSLLMIISILLFILGFVIL
jgi:hypothetical protein